MSKGPEVWMSTESRDAQIACAVPQSVKREGDRKEAQYKTGVKSQRAWKTMLRGFYLGHGGRFLKDVDGICI